MLQANKFTATGRFKAQVPSHSRPDADQYLDVIFDDSKWPMGLTEVMSLAMARLRVTNGDVRSGKVVLLDTHWRGSYKGATTAAKLLNSITSKVNHKMAFPKHVENIVIARIEQVHYSLTVIHKPFGHQLSSLGKCILFYDSLTHAGLNHEPAESQTFAATLVKDLRTAAAKLPDAPYNFQANIRFPFFIAESSQQPDYKSCMYFTLTTLDFLMHDIALGKAINPKEAERIPGVPQMYHPMNGVYYRYSLRSDLAEWAFSLRPDIPRSMVDAIVSNPDAQLYRRPAEYDIEAFNSQSAIDIDSELYRLGLKAFDDPSPGSTRTSQRAAAKQAAKAVQQLAQQQRRTSAKQANGNSAAQQDMDDAASDLDSDYVGDASDEADDDEALAECDEEGTLQQPTKAALTKATRSATAVAAATAAAGAAAAAAPQRKQSPSTAGQGGTGPVSELLSALKKHSGSHAPSAQAPAESPFQLASAAPLSAAPSATVTPASIAALGGQQALLLFKAMVQNQERQTALLETLVSRNGIGGAQNMDLDPCDTHRLKSDCYPQLLQLSRESPYMLPSDLITLTLQYLGHTSMADAIGVLGARKWSSLITKIRTQVRTNYRSKAMDAIKAACSTHGHLKGLWEGDLVDDVLQAKMVGYNHQQPGDTWKGPEYDSQLMQDLLRSYAKKQHIELVVVQQPGRPRRVDVTKTPFHMGEVALVATAAVSYMTGLPKQEPKAKQAVIAADGKEEEHEEEADDDDEDDEDEEDEQQQQADIELAAGSKRKRQGGNMMGSSVWYYKIYKTEYQKLADARRLNRVKLTFAPNSLLDELRKAAADATAAGEDSATPRLDAAAAKAVQRLQSGMKRAEYV